MRVRLVALLVGLIALTFLSSLPSFAADAGVVAAPGFGYGCDVSEANPKLVKKKGGIYSVISFQKGKKLLKAQLKAFALKSTPNSKKKVKKTKKVLEFVVACQSGQYGSSPDSPDSDLPPFNEPPGILPPGSSPTPTGTPTPAQTGSESPTPTPAQTSSASPSPSPTPPDETQASVGTGTDSIPATEIKIGFSFGGTQIPLSGGFQLAPGPVFPANIRNYALKTRFNQYLQVGFYVRKAIDDSYNRMSLEFKLCNNPLIYPNPAAIVNDLIPSQHLEAPIEFHVTGARVFPFTPQLSPFVKVSNSDPSTTTYRLNIPDFGSSYDNSIAKLDRLADGACIGDGFVLDQRAASAPASTFLDLQPLFPANPGKTIWGAVAPNFPGPTGAQLSDFANATGPWNVKQDVFYDSTKGESKVLTATLPIYSATVNFKIKDEHQTGFHSEWSQARTAGRYYATGDPSALPLHIRSAYVQLNRPMFFDGLDQSIMQVPMLDGRPQGKGLPPGATNLGRPSVAENVAIPLDTHGWLAPEIQHLSSRVESELAMVTGLPLVWEIARYYGETGIGNLLIINPQPAAGAKGFLNTPRGYLASAEAAYRAWLLDPSFQMTKVIGVLENFIKVLHELPFQPGANPNTQIANYNSDFPGQGTYGVVQQWSAPQLASNFGIPIFAMKAIKWDDFCGYSACNVSPVMEEGRFNLVALKIGLEFNRPMLVDAALESLDWWSTPGKGYHVSGGQEGLKWFVVPENPGIFGDPTTSPPSASPGFGNYGYGYAAGWAYYYAGRMLEQGQAPSNHPGTPFSVSAATFKSLAQKIKAATLATNVGGSAAYEPDLIWGWVGYGD